MSPSQEKLLADSLFEAEQAVATQSPARTPISTYRVQLHGSFRLTQATEIISYLYDLGITDLYTSPYLEARPGSVHGYDVFDHGRINPEVGGQDAHAQLVEALQSRGMGRVLDLVPNHMGVSGPNRFWLDILEMGPHSPYADFFDIDWQPIKAELAGRVLLPILGEPYGKALEENKLVLKRDGGKLSVMSNETKLPVSPESYAMVLGQGVSDLVARFDSDNPLVQEYLSVANSAESLPPRTSGKIEDIDRRMRERRVINHRLERLCSESGDVCEVIDNAIAIFRGNPEEPASFDRMHQFLELQVYRLAFWKVASQEINYRRFFDINDLAGLRMENPHVFELTHELILHWVSQGNVTGLRIDHPDGLADPAAYFWKLQEAIFLIRCRKRFDADGQDPLDWLSVAGRLRKRFRETAGEDPRSPLARGFPVVVEKILSRDETLPEDWPIGGTVGYEFLNGLNGLFVEPSSQEPMRQIYADFTGDAQPFAEIVYSAKIRMGQVALASEVNALARQLSRVSERDRRSRDFTLNDLREAIQETIGCFPVYRTYLAPGLATSPRDREIIQEAIAGARRKAPALDPTTFDFVERALLQEAPEGTTEEVRRLVEQFVRRFQQTTGPIQAKGLEDTAFYRQYPLLSLNEVGADPARYGRPPEEFHTHNQHRLLVWPESLGATATHDTKRGEDARIRINVLSEMPSEWKSHLEEWATTNANHRVHLDSRVVPDRREEYMLYQTLIGVWPMESGSDNVPEGLVARLQAYMTKAVREAKINTSWSDPDSRYVDALSQFVSTILEGDEAAKFLREFLPFQRKIARIGVSHSLSQTLLKIASPGIPDIYQGTELWDENLVDPDNRRPVDYIERAKLLAEIHAKLGDGKGRAELVRTLFANPSDGSIKLYVMTTALMHRREHPELYSQGKYLPVSIQGEKASKVVGFARVHEGQAVVILASRLVAEMAGNDGTTPPLGIKSWGETRAILPAGVEAKRWRDLLTDRIHENRAEIPIGDVFEDLPVALLVADAG